MRSNVIMSYVDIDYFMFVIYIKKKSEALTMRRHHAGVVQVQ